jgi:energy-coupling factor transporter transmembrane protein EcfT
VTPENLNGEAGGPSSSWLDAFDPRGRVICALAAAFAVSYLDSAPLLAAASVAAAALLLPDGGRGAAAMTPFLLRINKMAALTWFLFPVAYPGPRMWGFLSVNGVRAAFFITWKLNIISAAVFRLAVSMGAAKINGALAGLRVPAKLRGILVLSLRYIFILSGRMSTMTLAIRLRAPNQSAAAAMRALAYMVGATLIHCSDRAERVSMAFSLRGGLDGFSSCPDGSGAGGWKISDTFFCGGLALFLLALAAAERAWI